MATKYFTTTADSGAGSFRILWGSGMSSGDVIEPDPDIFKDSDVEILMSNYFATPATGSYTLRNGAAKRIIFNGQDTKYFFALSRAGLNLTFEGVDFVHGKRAQNAPFAATKYESLTFRRCGFYNNYGGTCGFLRDNSSTESNILLESCVAYGNRNATSYGQVVDIAGSNKTTLVVKGCTIGNNYSPTKKDITVEEDSGHVLTILDSLLEQDIDFESVGFVDLENNDFQLAGSSPYTHGATAFTSGDLDYLSLARKADGAIGAFEYYPSGALDEVFGDWTDVARYALGIKTNPDTPL